MIPDKHIPARTLLEVAVLLAVGVPPVRRKIEATSDRFSAMFRDRSECGKFTARQVIAACRQERAAKDPGEKFTTQNPESKIAWAIAGAENAFYAEDEAAKAKENASEVIKLGSGFLILPRGLPSHKEDYLLQKAGL